MFRGLEQLRLTGTTDGDGAATVDSPEAVLGALYAVQWIDGTLADGVDAVLSVVGPDATQTILTLSNANDDAMYYPRHAVHDNAGAAIAGLYDLPLINGKPRLAITSGGTTRTGGCVLYFVRY